MSAFLGRYRGQIRVHTDSDLRVFLRWCTDQGLDPLAAARMDIERYVRWLQDVRRYQPSTVSRRLSVVVGFYRVCVIDAILDHSPADYVRRPTVPAESPTPGLGHPQFEALITTARLSTNPNDFALVALLGLLGLRIFEACGASIADLGEEHGHCHADPRTTTRYDRARKNLDRRPNYIPARTWPPGHGQPLAALPSWVRPGCEACRPVSRKALDRGRPHAVIALDSGHSYAVVLVPGRAAASLSHQMPSHLLPVACRLLIRPVGHADPEAFPRRLDA
ncbi:Phage integrase, N-terminal SAM-like domain [Micromonospora rhizosphaerae]|uniref:Phage integrase, N-terminal SAM-like domain n=1 Tax=Micromonospora rhizosphaerae TaxID=568872 RepID=A0A1C6S0V8_9ACTN|nr:site-specific integrase [Micromonospora rhizosphaerae]SCL23129.1 Phage integrase, N-terminal SAM-like domain [Micromonospora rhizosphaerae]